MRNLIILISGGGSNMAAIVNAAVREGWEQQGLARVAAVVSNRPNAGGLVFAKQQGIPTFVFDHRGFDSREAFDHALAQHIRTFDKPLVVLAGFMRILSPGFVNQFQGQIVNIHPSLLPAFTGLHTHARAIEAGCRFAGATVHWVTAALDGGAIVDQAVVPILAGDDAQSLAARVLSQEHQLYPRALRSLLGEPDQR